MSVQVRNDVVLNLTNSAVSQSYNIPMAQLDKLTIQLAYTNGTTSGKTFSYKTTNQLTMTAHGQTTGSVGQLTTTGTLPTGLSTSTNYYVIVIDANTVSFASSLANAVAGTAVSVTGAGSGTDTFTPTSLSQVVKLSVSNDAVNPTNWTDLPNSTVTITSAGNTFWSSNATYISSSVTTPQIDPDANWVRILVTPTSGQLNLTATVCGTRLSPN